MKVTRTLCAIIVIVIGSMMSGRMAHADSDSLPPLPVLTSEWWQWGLSIPTQVNPQTDQTGEDCMVGQRDILWFLAGFFGTSRRPVERTCSVPANTTLFFPVINFVNINTPNVCGQGPQNLSVTDLRALARSFIDGAHDLSLRVDGKPSNNLLHRVKSQVFEVALPNDNLFNAPCTAAGLGTVPPGIYSPAVDDGFYVVLGSLKAGKHRIQFQATGPDGSMQDITYHLTVVPVLLQ